MFLHISAVGPENLDELEGAFKRIRQKRIKEKQFLYTTLPRLCVFEHIANIVYTCSSSCIYTSSVICMRSCYSIMF